MNHTIIKKALNEALTQKYYDELMNSEDEEHIFSVGFTADMKRLIRKTDDKLLYYSKYVAIAACACIAIGCAVLLPNLINSGIRTEPPVTTTTVTESVPDTGTTPSGTTAPVIVVTTEGTTEVTTTSPDETTLDTDSAVTSEITTTEITTTPTETTTTEEKVTETEDTADDEQADAEGDIIDDDSDSDTDYDSDTEVDQEEDEAEGDGDEEVGTDSDGDIVVEEEDDADDTTIDTEDDVETEEEDDVEIEDDCDIEVEEEDDVNPGAGGVPSFPEGNTLKEIYETYTSGDFEETRVSSVKYFPNQYSVGIFLNGCIYDLTFVEEYIISQADAVRLDKPDESNEADSPVDADADAPVMEDDAAVADTRNMRSIFVQLGEGELINNVDFYDSSRRKNYGEFFRGEVSDDVDVEDEEITFNIYAGIEIFENGMASYGNSVPMQFDPVATAELFKRFDKIGIPDNASTVAEIMEYTEISAESIIGGVAKIKNVYDIGLSGVEINTKEEIEGLYNIIKSLKKSPCAPGSVYGTHIEIEFYVSETFNTIRLVITDPFSDNPTLTISDKDNGYIVDITKKKAQEIIRYICKCAGVEEPYFYVTAEEYLGYVGVALEDVKSVSTRDEKDDTVWTYRITDPKKIQKVTEMVLAELKNTKYIGSEYTKSWLYADFEMENWTLSLCEGYIKVGPFAASLFEIDSKVLEKVTEYIRENADESMSEEIAVEDDHVVEDDVVIEVTDA